MSSTLTIATSAATTAGVVHGLNGLTTLALSLPVLGLAFAGVRGRKNRKLWLVAACSMFCVLLFAGCSGLGANANRNNGTLGTPPGAYTITVSATSSGNSPITHSQTFVLKVQ
jgi:apolipoprotein N-acyltransferase